MLYLFSGIGLRESVNDFEIYCISVATKPQVLATLKVKNLMLHPENKALNFLRMTSYLGIHHTILGTVIPGCFFKGTLFYKKPI